jgi:biotin operon repressor
VPRAKETTPAVARLLCGKRCWWTLGELAGLVGKHRVSVRLSVRELEAAGLAWVAARGVEIVVMWAPEPIEVSGPRVLGSAPRGARSLVFALLTSELRWWGRAEIARALGMSAPTVRVEVERLSAAGVAWLGVRPGGERVAMLAPDR